MRKLRSWIALPSVFAVLAAIAVGPATPAVSAVPSRNATASAATHARPVTQVAAPASCTPGTGNLLANPGMETPGNPATAPANWTFDNWGSTASPSYLASGFNSARSVLVTMTDASGGGDAKWMPADVCVQGLTSFAYSDQYISPNATNIVYKATSTTGAVTYDDVALSVPATAVGATTPKSYSGTFTVPTGTVMLSVYHLLKVVGKLQLDNVALTSDKPVVTNLVPNYSLETPEPLNPSLPQAWSPSFWGSNTHTFKYVTNDGSQGTRSVQTCITKYGSNPATAGDAKWVFAGQPLTRGADYRATFMYKSNALGALHVVGHYIRADGSEEFFGMPQPMPASNSAANWTQYSDVFGVPADAVTSDVFMFIAGVGCVSVDDFHLTPYTYVGFTAGTVSLTFDDSPDLNVINALPVLTQYGYKTTQYIPIADAQASAPTRAAIKKFAAAGHEIGAHTITHPHLTTLPCPGSQVTNELITPRTFLNGLVGQPINNFASPYGEYNKCVIDQIIAAGYTSHRTTDEGFNSRDNFNAMRLRVQNMTPSTTLTQFQGWVNKAKATKTWLILIYHNIVDKSVPSQNPPDPFDTYLSNFKAQMKWLSTAGIAVQRMDVALAALKAQLS